MQSDVDNKLYKSNNVSIATSSTGIVFDWFVRHNQEQRKCCFVPLGAGCVSIVFAFLQTSFCSLACERQTRRIREIAFDALLKKEITYFDTHAIGELSTILNRYDSNKRKYFLLFRQQLSFQQY